MQNALEKIIHLDFQGYWHVGSGKGRGYYLDEECLKDNYGLPFVSGKQLKGLLRHAVRRAEAWGWYKDIGLANCDGEATSFEDLLFGSASQSEGRFETSSGMIFVGNAELAKSEYDYLRDAEQASLRQYLYQPLYNTKIEHDSGTAEDMSLRGIEVALPMSLYTDLQLRLTALDDTLLQQQQAMLASNPNPWQIIEKALPLIDAIGAHRSRGLGEVVLSFVQELKD
ncbi:RAMP superfamily CRISPR-associated protein [Psychrobacter sp. APC 3426]|uniref:RAMP superfamily CRISPR-associated protein n=1 Tax=Psychrobacter sp. APC 3426 TaxID=3035177 RepID=UPI0025B53759|nr:RAMP superfamily CRISPR-associated protein [Psychrobacter sp. APC 3426]MDN3398455.1 RAMP superfamily CRISPR-associated protein [Psychrobacter sp. APC 3426]